MSVLSWNCRGLGNPATIRVLMDLVQAKKPSIIFLMETFSNKNKLEPIKIKLGFQGLFVVGSMGHSGGLALLWKEGTEVDVTGYSRNHIDTIVCLEGSNTRWRFTGYYGFPERARRKESWSLLKHLANLNALPWTIMGDFNDILKEEEKRGRNPHPQWLIRGFNETVDSCGLRDFAFNGYQFTWERSRGTNLWVEEKLDRILVNDAWLDLFDKATTTSIEATLSDHLPLMLWPIPSVRSSRRKSFKFENLWLREVQCREVVYNCWRNSLGVHLPARLELCGRAIWKWGRGVSTNFQEKIELCKQRMSVLRKRQDMDGVQRFTEAHREYLHLLEQQNCYWRQRAKEFWLQDGDINSKFFHNAVKSGRRNNLITRLKNSVGEWISEKQGMENMIFQHFNQLFSTSGGNMAQVLNCITPSITHAQNTNLVRAVTREEVKVALFSMDPDKSHGPDGMSPGFYQHYWDLIGADIIYFCNQFVRDGHMPEGTKKTHLCSFQRKPNRRHYRTLDQ